jgi:hypothetical protein
MVLIAASLPAHNTNLNNMIFTFLQIGCLTKATCYFFRLSTEAEGPIKDEQNFSFT